MQCPNCGYEPTMSEIQRSPGDCVKCGINFDGYKSSIDRQAELQRNRASELAEMSPGVRETVRLYPGARPVVIVDINMGFGAMVRFMVKWAIAAVPAAIILFMLFVGLTSFFGGLLQGIAKYF